MISKFHLLFVVGVTLISSAFARSQNFPPPRPASDFNVEITNLISTKFVGSVPADGKRSGLYGNGTLRHIADWKPSADVPSAACVIKVEFWIEQDAIRVEAVAYLGEMPPNSRPADWEKLQKLKIASRLVHLDETVNFDEARQVGIEPFVVKVVRAAPWSVGPPEIINKTQALQIESTSEERPAYTITVRNVSSKDIAAINWYGTQNDRKGGGGGEQSDPLIPAGKLFQIQQHFNNPAMNPADNLPTDVPLRRQIVIAAVLFEDGTFEGDTDVAAGMALSWTGDALQFSRIIPLLQTAAESAEQDESILAKLKTEVAALSEEVDPALVAKVLTHFPKLSEETQKLATVRFKPGLRLAKSSLLNEIQKFEYQRSGPVVKDMRTWLKQLITRYQRVQSPYL
jgi:hypothetical protein